MLKREKLDPAKSNIVEHYSFVNRQGRKIYVECLRPLPEVMFCDPQNTTKAKQQKALRK